MGVKGQMDHSPSADPASYCTQQMLLVLKIKYISAQFCMEKMKKQQKILVNRLHVTVIFRWSCISNPSEDGLLD